MLAPTLLIAALHAQLAPTQPSDPCRMICYEGTIEYVDESGMRHTPRVGSATLWRRAGQRWHQYEADILQGRVYVEMPACNTVLDIGRVVVDGREAFVVDEGWPEISWLARPAKPVQLNVFDATSKRPAQHVEVREFESTTPPDEIRPSVVITRSAPGRVILPSWSPDRDPWFVTGAGWRPTRRFWIRTPASPWVSVVADFERGGALDLWINEDKR